MTLLWRDPGAADAGASGKSVLTENTSPSIPPAAALQARVVTAADAPKVELFSRTPREGWAAWGNEAESGGAP